MNKQTPELLLVQGSQPVTEPVEICPAEAELADAVIEAVAGDRSAVEIERVLREYEAREATAKAQAEEDAKFWEADNPDLICHGQEAIGLYRNNFNAVVIRSEGRFEDPDQYIIVAQHHVPALIKRLQQLIK